MNQYAAQIAQRERTPADAVVEMYAPPEAQEKAEAKRVAEILLGPSSAMARSIKGYEARPQQLEVAATVWRALKGGRKAIIQAGTGIGKSFAAAAPTLAYLSKASHAEGRPMRALIVTAMKNLQAQYCGETLPVLQQHMGVPFCFELLKGKDNYLCLDAWARHGGSVRDAKVKRWVETPGKGDLAKLGIDLARKPLLKKALSACGKCPGAKDCGYSTECFYYKNKERASEDDYSMGVTNYHMLVHDALNGYQILPPYDVLILDEAHKLEEITRDCLTVRLSLSKIRDAVNTLQAEQLLSWDEAGQVTASAVDWWREFEDAAPEEAGKWSLSEHWSDIARDMKFSTPIFAAARQEDGDLMGGYDSQELKSAKEVAWALGPGRVLYAVREGDDGGPLALYSSPLNVGNWLKGAIYRDLPVVAMSATISTGSKEPFKRFKEAVGFENPIELMVDSPFSYATQARYLVAKYDGLKKPPRDQEQWCDLIEAKVASLIRITSGHALILCTSVAVMQELYYRIGPTLPKTWDIMLQGEMPKEDIIKCMRTGSHPVTFATKSFYEGVDIQGAGLQNVIVEKIPFPTKGDPVMEALRRQYGQGTEAFYRFDLPYAILHLLQVVGRLIRCMTDKGIVGLIDPRFSYASYASRILKALPGWMGALPNTEIPKIIGWLNGTGPAPEYPERRF